MTTNATSKEVEVADEQWKRLRELENEMIADLLELDADVMRIRALYIRSAGKRMPIGDYYALVSGLRNKLSAASARLVEAMVVCEPSETALAVDGGTREMPEAAVPSKP